VASAPGYSADLARVCTEPEEMRFISGGRPLTDDDDVRSIIQRTFAMWDEYGYGPWAAPHACRSLPLPSTSAAPSSATRSLR